MTDSRNAFRRFRRSITLPLRRPPTLLFLGTKDALIPVDTVTEFKKRMESAAVRCDLKLFEGGIHPLYSYRKGASPLRQEALGAADQFLSSIKLVAPLIISIQPHTMTRSFGVLSLLLSLTAFSAPAPLNLASSAKATASSTLESRYAPAKAIDGASPQTIRDG